MERSDTAATIFEEFQGNILKYSNDGALYTDTYNERIWNQTYEMAKPTIDMCEDYLPYMTKRERRFTSYFAGAGVKHRDNDDH